MEANNITAAPQVTDVSHYFELWQRYNVGDKDRFYKFLTTPGLERDDFFKSPGVETVFSGTVLTVTAQNFSPGPTISPINPESPFNPATSSPK